VSSEPPRAGADYPASYAQVRSWYPTDAACLDYLDWLRWPEGFWCPVCRGEQGWKLPDGRWSCGRCGRRVSATAGTIFHATRTPLTVWFAAGWLLVSQKQGISALGLKRTLGIGSEQTAWAMLHRYRTAMVRPGRDRLSGVVEVDETYMGGPEPGRSGRGALGKTLVAIAVEQRGRGIGRCRMQPIPDAKAASLREFLLAHVQPGAVVISDGWRSYPPACAEDYEHRPEPVHVLDEVSFVLIPRLLGGPSTQTGWRTLRPQMLPLDKPHLLEGAARSTGPTRLRRVMQPVPDDGGAALPSRSAGADTLRTAARSASSSSRLGVHGAATR